MTRQDDSQEVYNKKVHWVAHSIVTIIIIVIAVGLMMAMFSSKPQARKWGGAESPSVAVEIASLERQNYEAWIDSYGTVESLTRTQLVADVSGRVISVSPNIRAGGIFSQGDILVTLDDRNFHVEVDIAASAAADAQVRYLQEVAQADLAAREWNVRPDAGAAQLLALRKPQVAAAKAALQAANARLDKAKLDLERTQIKAPFDGKVLQQMVDVGQVVNPSQAIADIYGTDIVEVRLPVKIADLEHLLVPEDNDFNQARPKVLLLGELGARTYQWQGEIVRSEGAFDPATRMLYVVAQINEPFINNEQRPAIRIGQFLRAKIEGRKLEDVFVIPRRAVSQDYIVSVADEGILKKRKVRPLWTDAKSVVVAATVSTENEFALEQTTSTNSKLDALRSTDRLILTPTANLPEGTKVKSLEESTDKPAESEVQLVKAKRQQIESQTATSQTSSDTAQ
ncbi:efflux RND transporter periplasmic adaptor subunit [Paraglaciecola sp. 25GB23A]|uniref:efflux RND transporter periplasmic adaptor subunit n=1 Tax=Paraglaciecola sp. 25GB23A TaxID=3156068 RepID=UPI0032AFAC43